MIDIGARAAVDRLRDRHNSAEIGNNSKEIGDNSAEIGDGAAGIVDIAANVITAKLCPNGDWSSSVPGRKIPEGAVPMRKCLGIP